MPAASSSPTIERHAHGRLVPPEINERAFRPFWHAHDPLAWLADKGMITALEKHAADRFRITHHAAFGGGLRAQDWTAAPSGKHCGRPMTAMPERQIDALAHLKRIRASLGAKAFALLEAVLIEELRWSTLAQRGGHDHRTIKVWTAAAISALAAL